jgi:uncharacterized protein
MINESQKQIVLQHMKPLKPLKVGIFGSYARNENDQGSDLDLLVHLDYSFPITLFDIIRAEQNISDELGISVDIVTEESLSPHLRPYIEKDLIYIFE